MKYKTEVLQHFNVELTDDDLDSKLNQLLRAQHSDIQDPTLGWLMKWFEQKKVERSRQEFNRQRREQSLDDNDANEGFIKAMMNMDSPAVRLQEPHQE